MPGRKGLVQVGDALRRTATGEIGTMGKIRRPRKGGGLVYVLERARSGRPFEERATEWEPTDQTCQP